MLILLLSFFFLSFEFIICNKCCQIGLKDPPGYILVKSNAKSLKTIIARKKVLNIKKCEEFAEFKKGLAFNYGRANSNDESQVWSIEDDLNIPNCAILDCPEINNFTALQNLTGIKYYSSYPYWMNANYNSINGSLSCVPSVGLFMIFDKHLNFTDARNSCQKLNGTLAHVISEERTEGLAAFIGKMPTYVGLSSQGVKNVWKNEFDEPLECFDYRAWAEGEPTHSKGCVTLFRSSLKDLPSWKVVPCNLTFPYICEISPAKYRKHKNKKNKH